MIGFEKEGRMEVDITVKELCCPDFIIGKVWRSWWGTWVEKRNSIEYPPVQLTMTGIEKTSSTLSTTWSVG